MENEKTKFEMPETQYTRYESGEYNGKYLILMSGSEAHVFLPEIEFLSACKNNSMTDLLNNAANAAKKYQSTHTVTLILWPEQVILAFLTNFPFQEAGFNKVLGMEKEFDPRNGNHKINGVIFVDG